MHHTASALLALLLLVSPPQPPTTPTAEGSDAVAATPLSLLDHAAVQRRIDELSKTFGSLARPLDLGRSRQGRALRGLHVGRPLGEGEPARPAILLVAGLDGPYAYTSSLALDLARRVLESSSAEDGAEGPHRWLDDTDLVVVPRANPDACEARFIEPLTELEATGHGVDDDRDGRNGEDGPSDVNGDGRVTWMRVLDPDGEWLEDPLDPRALIRADAAKGQTGRYALWPEGLDSDGDEAVAEDPLHDAVVNRNFPHAFEEHAPASGRYPTDEPECLALIEFVLARPEISAVLVLGAQDNLVETPKGTPDSAPSSKRVPKPGLLASDAAFVKELGRRFGESAGVGVKSKASSDGSFQAWCYEERGLWTLTLCPWELPEKDLPKEEPTEAGGEGEDGATQAKAPEEAAPESKDAKPAKEGKGRDKKNSKGPKPSADAKRLAWIDAEGEDHRFVPWTPFEHPQLGAVEIGGFAPFARIEPPTETLGEIADSLAAFLPELAGLPARLRVAEFSTESRGENLQHVRAVLVNEGYLPLLSTKAQRTRTVRPARVELELPEGARLVAGSPFELVDDLTGSGGRREIEWMYVGATGATLTVDSDHAGRLSVSKEVR